MGYIKVVQYGNYTEIYDYEKDYVKPRSRKPLSKLDKKRKIARKAGQPVRRSKFSIRRARTSFFRLCHANNIKAQSVTFCTLTFMEDKPYSDCLRDLSNFARRLKHGFQSEGHSEISYIGVPERTKAQRTHFHLLIYNLQARDVLSERDTRNIQRSCWQKGFLDLRLAEGVDSRIAGYMAKYMGKALTNPDYEFRRAYSCSRNIDKVRIHTSNTIPYDKDFTPYPTDQLAERVSTYEVPYLGTCKFSRYQVL